MTTNHDDIRQRLAAVERIDWADARNARQEEFYGTGPPSDRSWSFGRT
ncbi:hypothetical protein ACWEPL_12385 [Nonomuraea sp. NPDC004186]